MQNPEKTCEVCHWNERKDNMRDDGIQQCFDDDSHPTRPHPKGPLTSINATNIAGTYKKEIAGGATGVMLFIALVGIVFYIKKRRATAEVPRVDVNPVYGDYADPDYVCEMHDTNEDYAATDIYQEGGAQARDFNSTYGH
jgi:hypothetical protein